MGTDCEDATPDDLPVRHSTSPAMNPRTHFATLARYNAWATRRLLDGVAALGEDDYRRDVGLFFKSVHGTLNHLLLGEHGVWFERFAGRASPRVDLGAEVEPNRTRLAERLLEGAARWQPLIECQDKWDMVLILRAISATRNNDQLSSTSAVLSNVAKQVQQR